MLTGKLVRVRHARNRLVPQYLAPANEGWIGLAGELLYAYRSAAGRTGFAGSCSRRAGRPRG